jgi:putative transposase
VLRHEVPQQEGCIESQVREAKFLQKSLCRHGQVDQIVTDRLASYGAALKVLGSIDKREVGRWLNNRVEN